MNVDRFSFSERLASITAWIASSDFVAVDTELTGLHTDRDCMPQTLDTLEERYQKLKTSANAFAIVQYGVCTFHWDAASKSYIARPFNFYTFQRPPGGRESPDFGFQCQSSSISFLVENHFNFSKLFQTGISFINRDQEASFKDQLMSQALRQVSMQSQPQSQSQPATPVLSRVSSASVAASPSTTASAPINLVSASPAPDTASPQLTKKEQEQAFIAGVVQKVEAWLAQPEPTSTLILPPCNSYYRRLVYQEMEQRYPSGFLIESVNPSEPTTNFSHKSLAITRNSVEEKASRDEARSQQLLQQQSEAQRVYQTLMNDTIGFRHVLDAISKNKKLVVGHNMMLDLVHSYSKFFKRLPESLSEFKKGMQEFLPFVVDTKSLASCPEFEQKFESTALGEMVKTLATPTSFAATPRIVCDPEFESYPNPFAANIGSQPLQRTASQNDAMQVDENVRAELLHEAGYDAFISGCGFVALAHNLAAIQARRSAVASSSYTLDDIAPNQTSKPQQHEAEFAKFATVGGESIVGPKSSVLSRFVNKVYLMRSDFPYLCLDGEDASVARDNVVFVHGFPANWRESDIRTAFNNAGMGPLRGFAWKGDDAALAVLPESVNVRTVLEKTRDYQKQLQRKREQLVQGSQSVGLLGPPPSNLAPMVLANEANHMSDGGSEKENAINGGGIGLLPTPSAPATPTSVQSLAASSAAASGAQPLFPFYAMSFEEYTVLTKEVSAEKERISARLKQEMQAFEAQRRIDLALNGAPVAAAAAATATTKRLAAPRTASSLDMDEDAPSPVVKKMRSDAK